MNALPQFKLEKNQQIEFLKCYFTPEERAELSDRMCRAIALKLEKEEEFKVIKKQFSEEIEAQQLEVNRLARRLNFGYEHRNVVCEMLLNQPEAGKKTLIRTDVPGEVVRTYSMDGEDQITAAPPEKLFETAPEQEPVATIVAIAEAVAEQVNSGALDTPNVKVTAEVSPLLADSEPTQKPKRTRKPKLQGQDALLPDKRTNFPHGHNAGGPQ
jgi:hypothetical protein